MKVRDLIARLSALRVAGLLDEWGEEPPGDVRANRLVFDKVELMGFERRGLLGSASTGGFHATLRKKRQESGSCY